MYLFSLLFTCIPIVKSLDTDNCLLFQCTSGSTRANCIEPVGNYIQISPCVNGLICNASELNTISNFNTVTCTKNTPVIDLCEDPSLVVYTGKQCCISSNCQSGNCTNSVCDGTLESNLCNVDEECLPGYYCDVVCTKEILTNCNRDNMCPIGYGCNNTNCIQFRTLSIGEYAENTAFCSTGYIYNGRCDAVAAYVNNKKLDSSRICDLLDICQYYTVYSNTFIQQSLCMCSGIKGSTTGYCGYYANVSTDVEAFYKALVYSTSICSGNYSHSTDPDVLYTCESISLDDYNYGSIMLNRYTYFNVYMSGSIDHCARPLGLFNPWYDASTYSYIRALGIRLILFIIYAI